MVDVLSIPSILGDFLSMFYKWNWLILFSSRKTDCHRKSPHSQLPIPPLPIEAGGMGLGRETGGPLSASQKKRLRVQKWHDFFGRRNRNRPTVLEIVLAH